MHHAVLLDRDSWILYNTRSFRALPPRPHDNRVWGELTLSHNTTTCVSAYVIDLTATVDGFHLVYERGDLITVAHAPRLRVRLDALQHATHAAELLPGQTAECWGSGVTNSLDTGEAATAVTSPSPALLERLNQDQHYSFLRV